MGFPDRSDTILNITERKMKSDTKRKDWKGKEKNPLKAIKIATSCRLYFDSKTSGRPERL